MIKTGYILCSQDNTYRSEPIVTSIAFSTNKLELERELEILEKNYSTKLEKFKSQSANCDKYVEKFEKAWTKYEQKNVFYIPRINRLTIKPQTKEEHAECKRIKNLNILNNEKNEILKHLEKCKFLACWIVSNSPHNDFKEFIEISEDGSQIVINSYEDNTSFFVCELGKEVSEEF